MSETEAAESRPSSARWEVATCLVLLAIGFAVCFTQVKHYRSQGQQPRFYQENFGPAVMMACGYGFTAPPAHSTPASLTDFLLLRAPTFRCEDFDAAMEPAQVTWNGTWYYLYGTVSLIWRVAGFSWTVLDGLVAAFGAFELIAFYGLFRLIASRGAAIVCALLVLLAPFNLEQLMYLRDFSKAPFVLASVFVLASMILRPFTPTMTFALAATFGVIVGIGYGFRSDLIVMVPFGVVMIAVFLPGSLRTMWRRNLAAAAAAFVAFLIAGLPPLLGQRTGGCQFHYALLGLTSPLTDHMNVVSPMYAWGNHFLDTFVDLKVGDYAHRIMGLEPPILCAPDYDRASGELFFRMAKTFPADLVVHAYGSALTILRSGLPIPPLERLVEYIPGAYLVARPIDRALYHLGVAGPLLAIAAVAAAWGRAPRLGLALTAFILFLTGYPAVEFEARHWFHLRFLPLWCAVALWATWPRRPRLAVADVPRTTVPEVAAMLAVAIGMVLTIVRAGTLGSLESMTGRVPWAFAVARPLDQLVGVIGIVGPAMVVTGLAVAWRLTPRLGLALTPLIFVLATAHPTIELAFARWFSLYLLPLWCALALWAAWPRRSYLMATDLWRGLVPVAATVLLMAAALGGLRLVQRSPVHALIGTYLAAPVEELATTPSRHGLDVEWKPAEFGSYPTLRAADLLAVSIAPSGCGAAGPIDVTFHYDAPMVSHDMTSTMRVVRESAGPTQVFFPVFSLTQFDKSLLRFRGLEVADRSADCLTRVARVTDRTLPLLVQVQVPPAWHDHSYYQSLRLPRILRFLE